MRSPAFLIPFLICSYATQPQARPTAESCRKQTKLFYNAPSIAMLPAQQRSGIIQVILPELKDSQAAMGFDEHDLTPVRLSSMLRYTILAPGARGERVVAVIYRDPTACGHHGQCPGYLLGIAPHKVRSLVPQNGRVCMSVGGAWGAAVMPAEKGAYPDLLFLATISSSEVAVACYRWQGKLYAGNCDVPCAHVLAHADQQ